MKAWKTTTRQHNNATNIRTDLNDEDFVARPILLVAVAGYQVVERAVRRLLLERREPDDVRLHRVVVVRVLQLDNVPSCGGDESTRGAERAIKESAGGEGAQG